MADATHGYNILISLLVGCNQCYQNATLQRKQVQKYRIDAYSWQTLNWIEAPELQIIGIYKTLQYKIDSNFRNLQDFVGAP